jgi:hypothetical protein
VCDHVAVLALATVYVNSLNKNSLCENLNSLSNRNEKFWKIIEEKIFKLRIIVPFGMWTSVLFAKLDPFYVCSCNAKLYTMTTLK